MLFAFNCTLNGSLDSRYELNWLKSDLWAKQTWTYSANFSIEGWESQGSGSRVQLVFDGIKMGAHVKVPQLKSGFLGTKWH